MDPMGSHQAPRTTQHPFLGLWDASLHPAWLPGVVLANTSEPSTLLTLPSVRSLIINSSLGETWFAKFSPGAPTGRGCPQRQQAEMPSWRTRLHPPFPQEVPQARPGQARPRSSAAPSPCPSSSPSLWGHPRTCFWVFPTGSIFLGPNSSHTHPPACS